MHATTIKHRCPHCDTMLQTVEKMAGRSFDCPNCDGNLTVPHPQALMPMRRPVAMPEVIDDDFDGDLDVPRRKRRRDDDDKPVKLRLGEYAELEAEVDGTTRNSMALVTTGGILVGLGAILVWLFGGKSKSS
jgi:hypothetical protein